MTWWHWRCEFRRLPLLLLPRSGIDANPIPNISNRSLRIADFVSLPRNSGSSSSRTLGRTIVAVLAEVFVGGYSFSGDGVFVPVAVSVVGLGGTGSVGVLALVVAEEEPGGEGEEGGAEEGADDYAGYAA